MVGVRVSDDLRGRIERWAARQDDTPRLSEAVRRLVEIGLHASPRKGKLADAEAAKASAMAQREIDRLLTNAAAAPEEHARRKRRLVKGPKEFRDLRKD